MTRDDLILAGGNALSFSAFLSGIDKVISVLLLTATFVYTIVRIGNELEKRKHLRNDRTDSE